MLDLLKRALVLDELDGALAVTTTGGRAALLAGEAGLEGEQLGVPGRVWRLSGYLVRSALLPMNSQRGTR